MSTSKVDLKKGSMDGTITTVKVVGQASGQSVTYYVRTDKILGKLGDRLTIRDLQAEALEIIPETFQDTISQIRGFNLASTFQNKVITATSTGGFADLSTTSTNLTNGLDSQIPHVNQDFNGKRIVEITAGSEKTDLG